MLRKIRAHYLKDSSSAHYEAFARMINDLKKGNEAIDAHTQKNAATIAELNRENNELEAARKKNEALCSNIEKLLS